MAGDSKPTNLRLASHTLSPLATCAHPNRSCRPRAVGSHRDSHPRSAGARSQKARSEAPKAVRLCRLVYMAGSLGILFACRTHYMGVQWDYKHKINRFCVRPRLDPGPLRSASASTICVQYIKLYTLVYRSIPIARADRTESLDCNCRVRVHTSGSARLAGALAWEH